MKDESLKAGAIAIARTLQAHGHEAYLVGGCVRDLVLGREPEDFDIVTSARPEEIQAMFLGTVAVGAKFGVIIVIHGGHHYEVATFRKEGGYEDGRHPSTVSFGTLREDVCRRDFTVNSLAMVPETDEIIDYVGGLDDLRRGWIRAIGVPAERFAEDHLRMLRAVRFAAQLGFCIEGETFSAIVAQAPNIRHISAERIREELTKIITRRRGRYGLELLKETGLMRELLPEVEVLQSIDQPLAFHPEGDVFAHTLRIFEIIDTEGESIDRRLAWAALLHDTGKALTRSEQDGEVHFYGHTEKSVEIAEGVMERLHFSTDDRETVRELVKHHMRFMHVKDMAPRTLKRFLRLPHFSLHLALHRLDCLASHGSLDNYEFCLAAWRSFSPETLHPPRLVTGHDLISWGFTPGPLFGEILRAMEDAQLDGYICTPEEARAFVMSRWGEKARG